MKDFLVRGKLEDLDPEVFKMAQLETERQNRKLIMIPSESTAPLAVREALATSFQNIYAEGYPDDAQRTMSEGELLDYPARLAEYRRYSDPRFYKGVEYADLIESLARRRCAEAFAANGKTADDLFVNVQPLSGAPANNAVYPALLNPGDTVLAMSLLHGGHLTHGSSVNRSGRFYNVIHYLVDPVTEKVDYDRIAAQALEFKPKMIIAGYTSYPWLPDWKKFREIADSVGAYLLADISHIAGLVAGGALASPIGYAHVSTFTTHKTLCGPRGACIITTDSALAKKIDRSIFPGEQGGPHVHVFAALALTFKLTQTREFKDLQKQITANCAALTAQMQKRGLRISYSGTDTHLVNVDCKSVVGPDGTPLMGDMAARILDLAGIVCNRNTIPGDKSSFASSGIRLGTPWLTQRGFKEAEMVKLADIIADILFACTPYTIETRKGPADRAKIDFQAFNSAKLAVRKMAEEAGIAEETIKHGYPHFFYLDDAPVSKSTTATLHISGKNVRPFMNFTIAGDVELLKPGDAVETTFSAGPKVIPVTVKCINAREFLVQFNRVEFGLVATWLRDLSDGFTGFDADYRRRLPGPVIVEEIESGQIQAAKLIGSSKPYFIGKTDGKVDALPEFKWADKEGELMFTPLNATHKAMGAKMVPFAGWEMPVWYSSVVEEHLATRQAAGLFDVSHMGVYQAEGPDAVVFLDSVCGNDIAGLEVGESCYTHFLDPDANVIDDLLVYRRAEEVFLVVVNASNDDKDWTWLNKVRQGETLVDRLNPSSRAFGRGVNLRNLRDPKSGKDMRVDIALQGPKSRDILLALGCDGPTRKRIMGLKRTQLCEAEIGGFNLVVSRTGYTGEKMAFELFVHPDRSVELWNALCEKGKPMGMLPCGLGARDSLRTEAGLPLYGHEMGGDFNLGVAEAGFGSYVKLYKPWFIGRENFAEREKSRCTVVTRFRFNEKGVRMAHHGDVVLDKKGKVVGVVTSCAVDSEGYLTGQAALEIKSAVEGTTVFIFPGSPATTGKPPSQLAAGDKVTLPSQASVLSKFPKA